MQKRRLGKTTIEVSVIGLGTVKFGRNQGVKYPTAFNLPTQKELAHLLEEAQKQGINLLDTAPAYGVSEERLGELLQCKRHEWVISTKVGEEFTNGESHFDFSATAIQQSVERSLKRLRTDYLDMVLVHSNGDDQQLIEDDNVFTTLAALKKSGKIRAYGISTKTIAGGLLAVDMADAIMLTFNPAYTAERDVIAYAEKKQKAILIKKALASGHLDQLSVKDPIAHTMQFIFQEPGITSVIVGTINPLHLKTNVECAMRALQQPPLAMPAA